MKLEKAIDFFCSWNVEGEVTTKRPLDREARKTHEIAVAVYDWGGKAGHAVVRVRVADVNDRRPRFAVGRYAALAPADRPPGAAFLRVHATDADAGDNARITYSIFDGPNATAGTYTHTCYCCCCCSCWTGKVLRKVSGLKNGSNSIRLGSKTDPKVFVYLERIFTE